MSWSDVWRLCVAHAQFVRPADADHLGDGAAGLEAVVVMASEEANLGVIVPAAPNCWPDGGRILAGSRAGYASLYESATMPGRAS